MKAIVIGGGIGGLCAALALQQAGVDTTVYEAAPKYKGLGAGVGLAANAMQGLARLGVMDEVVAVKRGKQLDALVIFDENGREISNMDTRSLSNKYGINNFVIHRADLHEVLLNHLRAESVILDKRCETVEQVGDKVQVMFTDGSQVTADLLIAADGISSVVRQYLVPKSIPRYAGYTCWRAVTDNPGIKINEMISAETWAPQGRVGIAPLRNNKIYWYACINASQRDEKMRNMTPEKLARHFETVHSPVEAVLASTAPEQIIWNDIADLNPLKHFVYGRIVLLGDAAHATTPNMGQGACQAIEDAVVLAQCLKQYTDLAKALNRYEKRRKARTATVIKLSRRLGEVAQWRNPLLGKIRNTLFRAMPDFITQRQMEDLYRVDF
jgi:2-polyprenyl-6-methoxyphenol hydroxylase-like FAD-dependent oxidoreductase